MKKKFDTTSIMSELRGQSVFFPNYQKEIQQEVGAGADSPSPKAEKKRPKLRKASVVERHHDAMIPSNHDTTTPSAEDDILEKARKAVKQIGKEAATHRFTLEEKNNLADIEYSYHRQGIRTSENEITRIAINYFIEEYRINGERSLLAKVLKLLNS